MSNILNPELLLLTIWLAIVSADGVAAVTATNQNREFGGRRSTSASLRPRAFVKGDLIRIYSGFGATTDVFRAELKKSPIQGRDYVYFRAALKRDATPPALPSLRGSWREAKVVGRETWSNLVEITVQQLTPREPWHGAYFQFLSQERVFYRDDTGRIVAARLEQKPARVEIVRSYSPGELGALLAGPLSDTLESTRGEERIFLLTEHLEGKPPRYMLLDLDQKICAFLFPRDASNSPNGPLKLESRIRFFSSLIVESHGLAILKNPVSSAGRLINTACQVSAGLLRIRLPTPPAIPLEPGTQPGMDLVDWEQWLTRRTGGHADQGSVKFLINGEEFFPAFTTRLEAARYEANLRLCIFDNDDVAVDMADLLKRCSRKIGVRVLVDLMSSQASQQAQPETLLREGFISPKSIRQYLRHGSQVRVRSARNPWFTSDHTKVLTIDRQYAFLGGMNIGREYRYEWHDLMVEIEGPIVSRLDHDFQKAWAHAGPMGDLAYLDALLTSARPARFDSTNRHWAVIRRLQTRTGNLQIRRAIFEAFRRARNHIFLENSYLYDPSVIDALIKARRRGVDVRVILPERSDNVGGNSSVYVTANYLFRNGVRVYVYPGMTHVKALLVDGWACFGSANFNRLSLRRNLETNLATSDSDIANRMRRELFEEDFAKSHELREPIEVHWTDYLADSILSQF